MLPDPGRTVMNRLVYLTPRQGTLLGLIWIAVQKSREQGGEACIKDPLLRELIFTAQNRGLIGLNAQFQFYRSSLPELDSAGMRMILKELKDQGFLHISETADTIGFMGTSFLELPTGIFRYINVFGFAELVEEFTGDGDDR